MFKQRNDCSLAPNSCANNKKDKTTNHRNRIAHGYIVLLFAGIEQNIVQITGQKTLWLVMMYK